MKYVGVDLHKKTISVCVVSQARETLASRRLFCDDAGTPDVTPLK